MLKKETLKLIGLYLLTVLETLFAFASSILFVSLMFCYLVGFDIRVITMQSVLLISSICGWKASFKDEEKIKERLEK